MRLDEDVGAQDRPTPKRRYSIRESEEEPKQFYYVQVGQSGEDLNVSETYTRREDAERGVRDANPGELVEVTHEYEDGSTRIEMVRG